MPADKTLPGPCRGLLVGSTSRVSQIIFDYMHICEKRGEILDPEAFVDLWTVANAIAEHAFRDGEPPSDLIDRILGKA